MQKNVPQKKPKIPKKEWGSIYSEEDTKEMRVCRTTPTRECTIPPMRPSEGVSIKDIGQNCFRIKLNF